MSFTTDTNELINISQENQTRLYLSVVDVFIFFFSQWVGKGGKGGMSRSQWVYLVEMVARLQQQT